MSDIFSIAKSGILTYQRALSTTGHNIANASTEGYSRQRVNINAREPQFIGGFFVGSGVELSSTERIVDQVVTDQIQTNISLIRENQKLFDEASKIDSLLSKSATSVGETMDLFFSALQGVNADPGSVNARESFIRQTQSLIDRFHAIDTQLNSEISLTNQSLETYVETINGLTASIAESNELITSSAVAAPDSYDQRDRLIKELAEVVSIRTIEQDNGSVTISLSNGQALISGSTVNTLESIISSVDPRFTEFQLRTASNQVQAVQSSSITGGNMGGLIRYRDEVVDPALRALSRLALSLGDSFNTQHRLGMDMGNNIGSDFFNDINDTTSTINRVIANDKNTGSLNLTASISDVTQLTDDAYELKALAGGTYVLENMTTDEITTLSGFPATQFGFTINFSSGTPALNDTFVISPTRNASRSLSLQVTDPLSIAISMPIRTSSDTDNAGSATISVGEVIDTTNASFATAQALSPPYRVEFLNTTSYRILNDSTGAVIQGGPIPYNSAMVNEIFPVRTVVNTNAQNAAVGALPTIGAGDLTINGTAIAAAVADGVSPAADASSSAIALAFAINSSTGTHGVTATVKSSSYVMGTYTPGALVAGDLTINGVAILDAVGTQTDLLNAVNGAFPVTGVSASLNSAGDVVFGTSDGRNMEIVSTNASAANFSNFALNTPANDLVQRAGLILTDDPNSTTATSVTIGGVMPTNANIPAGVYNQIDPGYRASITGVPQAGDVFRVNYNTDAASDNRNGSALAGLQSQTSYNANTTTLNGMFSNLIIDIGTKAHQANLQEQAADALLTNLEARQQAISGVNLDEEAADLLAYEKLYQANARVLQTANQMLTILFDAL